MYSLHINFGFFYLVISCNSVYKRKGEIYFHRFIIASFITTSLQWIVFILEYHQFKSKIVGETTKYEIMFERGLSLNLISYGLTAVLAFLGLESNIRWENIIGRFKIIHSNFPTSIHLPSEAIASHPPRNVPKRLVLKFYKWSWKDSKNKIYKANYSAYYKNILRRSKRKLILYSLTPNVDYFTSFLQNQYKQINYQHLQQCRCTKQYYTCCSQRKCNWKKIEIQVNIERYNNNNNNDYDNFDDPQLNNSYIDATDVAFLNKLGFSFISNFTLPKNCSWNIINFLQQQFEFSMKFSEMYICIVESLIINNNGLHLVNCLVNELINPQHKQMVISLVTNDIFKQWPPPLTLLSLTKVRHFIKEKKIVYFSFIPPLIQRLIANPLENTDILDIFSIINLEYTNYWTEKEFRYGIFEELSIKSLQSTILEINNELQTIQTIKFSTCSTTDKISFSTQREILEKDTHV